VRASLASAERIYAVLGAADKIDSTFFRAGHSFHGEVAFERLGRWL
jgi:hypothetical protein